MKLQHFCFIRCIDNWSCDCSIEISAVLINGSLPTPLSVLPMDSFKLIFTIFKHLLPVQMEAGWLITPIDIVEHRSFVFWWNYQAVGISLSSETQGEVFKHAGTEKPLGTDSYQTISTRSSECWILIGPTKLLCINTRRLCLRILVRFVHQGCAWKGNFNFLFS